MPRTNRDGKDIRLVVSWLCGRYVPDAEMADAVGIPATNYSRRKDADDFPTFEEIRKVAERFNLSALALHIAFGYLDIGVVLLDDDSMRQYVEQGGGDVPNLPGRTAKPDADVSRTSGRRRKRADAPPGP